MAEDDCGVSFYFHLYLDSGVEFRLPALGSKEPLPTKASCWPFLHFCFLNILHSQSSEGNVILYMFRFYFLFKLKKIFLFISNKL